MSESCPLKKMKDKEIEKTAIRPELPKVTKKNSYSNTNALPSWLDFMREQKYMDVCMPNGTGRDDVVTRLDAVDCLTRFAAKNWLERDKTADCSFSDISELNESMQQKIAWLCEVGLLRGQNGTFKPEAELNQAVMLSILARSWAWYLNENTDPWFKKYYEYAVGQWWVKAGLSQEVFEQSLTRQDLWLWLYQTHKTTWASSIINN